jgi:maltose alpha-D-glucosyltransferase / alpha-amylase
MMAQMESGVRILFLIFELEKLLDELTYEIGNRPDWIEVPLQGILLAVGQPQPAPAS